MKRLRRRLAWLLVRLAERIDPDGTMRLRPSGWVLGDSLTTVNIPSSSLPWCLCGSDLSCPTHPFNNPNPWPWSGSVTVSPPPVGDQIIYNT